MAYKKEYSKVGKKYTTEKKPAYKPKRGNTDGSWFMINGYGNTGSRFKVNGSGYETPKWHFKNEIN